MKLHLDFETRSKTDLKASGVYRYVEDPSTYIWCFAWQLDKGPVQGWYNGQDIPQEITDHVRAGDIVCAHNAMFERIVWNNVLKRDYQWLPDLAIEQMDCTMVRALVMNLPADLDTLGIVLGLAEKKDKEGSRLMKQMMKPRDEINNTWWDDPDRQQRLLAYCMQDVRTELGVDAALPELTDAEREMWWLDQRINDRGVPVDLDFIHKAVDLVSYAKVRADAEMSRVTEGSVNRCTEAARLIAWLNARGILTETMRKGDQEWLLELAEINGDKDAQYAIELRRTASKTSTAKYEKTLDCVCADGSVRGLLQFAGASQTGRWAGRLVQPQNYPRIDDDTESAQVAWTVNVVKHHAPADAYDLIELMGPPRLPNGDQQQGVATLAWLSKSLRSTIAVNGSDKFVGGDFSNIEGRINAWLAQETWKLEAFEAYDAGTGPDLYRLTFSRGFNVPVEDVTKPQRQIGKVMELALGYQGGVGAFATFVYTYMMKLHSLAIAVYNTTDSDVWNTTASRWEHAKDKLGLSRDEWTGAKIVVTNWRRANPAIVASWWELQDAAIQAVDQPHVFVSVLNGRSYYLSDGNFLYCFLPSGRVICYPQAHVALEVVEQIYDGLQYVDVDALLPEELANLLDRGYKIYERKRRGVRFRGLNENKQVIRQPLYGGYQDENIVQATACDVMRYAMLRTERAHYPLILTVHDELLARLARQYGSPGHYSNLMSEQPPWADGLPIVTKAWEGVVYDKA